MAVRRHANGVVGKTGCAVSRNLASRIRMLSTAWRLCIRIANAWRQRKVLVICWSWTTVRSRQWGPAVITLCTAQPRPTRMHVNVVWVQNRGTTQRIGVSSGSYTLRISIQTMQQETAALMHVHSAARRVTAVRGAAIRAAPTSWLMIMTASMPTRR